jgi:hypothetical protein
MPHALSTSDSFIWSSMKYLVKSIKYKAPYCVTCFILLLLPRQIISFCKQVKAKIRTSEEHLSYNSSWHLIAFVFRTDPCDSLCQRLPHSSLSIITCYRHHRTFSSRSAHSDCLLLLQMFHDVTQLGCGNADCYGTDPFSGVVKTMHLERAQFAQEKSGICALAQGFNKCS